MFQNISKKPTYILSKDAIRLYETGPSGGVSILCGRWTIPTKAGSEKDSFILANNFLGQIIKKLQHFKV